MKNALILHGTNGNSTSNWLPWLKEKLAEKNWGVWVPDLPHAEMPNTKRYNEFILANKDWQFNSESVLIGHSSGAVEILSLLQHLPKNVVVDTCILVGSFINDLGWDDLKELFIEPLDFKRIKTHAKHFIFIHSDNDPYCPLDHAKFLSEKLDGKLIVLKGQQHFSTSVGGEKYKKFPLLLKLID